MKRDVFLRDIDPERGGKDEGAPLYNRSLYLMIQRKQRGMRMKGNPSNAPMPIILKVYEYKGKRYVGHVQERQDGTFNFYGVPLSRACMEYEPKTDWIRVWDRKPREIKTFWQKYKKHGMCYLDPWHRGYDVRWKYSPKRRTRRCMDCGRKEVKTVRRERRVYTHETWSRK